MSDDLERSARRARSLLAVARHPNTPPAEAQTAQRLARVLMLRVGLTDADLEPGGGIRFNSDPAGHYERPSAPHTPGRKWTIYERAQAAAASNGDWGGLNVVFRVMVMDETGRTTNVNLADWLRRHGTSVT